MAYGYGGLVPPMNLQPEYTFNSPIDTGYRDLESYIVPYTTPYRQPLESPVSDISPTTPVGLVKGVTNGIRAIGSDFAKGIGDASPTSTINAIGNLIGNVGNLWQGWQQSKLAKKALNHQMDVFNKSYDAQRKLTNSRLEDRQRARVGANSSAYQSVDSYMNQYGIK